MQGFADISAARKAIDAAASGWRSTGTWSIAQVFDHAAQSIEYSLRGFPELKSAAFRATAGKLAFAWFDSRGAMSHSLSEPIPGAPALAGDMAVAVTRLQAAWQAFEGHSGAFAPHFAYGALDKAQYTRAHLMHLANHWTEFSRA